MSRYELVNLAGPIRPRVHVGMNTYHGGDQPRVKALLESYRATVGPRDDVALTLLDDGSPRQPAREQLCNLAIEHDANLLQKPANGGITAAWNDLARFCPGAEHVVLLNDDLVLTPRWLDNLIYFLDHNDCGGVGLGLWFCTPDDLPFLVAGVRGPRGNREGYFGAEAHPVVPRHPITKIPDPALGEHALDEPPGVMMCPPGCAFGFKRELFERVGGFDESMIQTHNESHLGTAFAEAGFPSFVIPWPKVWHLWSQTFKENPEVGIKAVGDRAAYIRRWGGDFDVTHPRYLGGGRLPPRVVRWLDRTGRECEKELVIS